MDLPWGDEKTTQFVTNVGLITTDGPYGPNIMACEWTHHVSYKPGLIAVCIGHNKATAENIHATKEFGINLSAVDQSSIASISGNNSGKQVDKIQVLKKLNVKFYKAKHIKTLMVEGSALNVECKLLQEIPLGDHTLFVGEVLEASTTKKEPLVYHKTQYFNLGKKVEKPSQEKLEQIKKLIEEAKK